MRKHITWLIPILYIVVLLLLGLVQTWLPKAQPWIEVTKIGLSWQVLLIVFLSSIIYLFEEPMRVFLYKIKGIQTDKLKIDTQQEQDINSIPVDTVNKFMLHRDSEWQRSFDEVAAIAQSVINEKEEIAEELSTYIKNLQEKINVVEYERIKWQFKYADRYLVGRTKLILKIISLSSSITPDIVWQNYEKILNTIEERDAVFNALIEMNFIEQQLNEYYVTQSGELYIGFLEEVYKVDWNVLIDVLVKPSRTDFT
ncbi:hypothetical protein NYE69_17915 [Paenibacillus sp. FSL R5-0527]|uniref:hypothetical protein n=1 Tax=Paenibacillus TaxID=44249 RepID=UPI00097AE68F|nr:hypothetical protein [Paenibacillus macerans]MEC0329159.1 hypothetical protein [Paenibacillus macerans]OMG47228.1 hypothetical protein BK140_23050 [Paenibacillus macerans]